MVIILEDYGLVRIREFLVKVLVGKLLVNFQTKNYRVSAGSYILSL